MPIKVKHKLETGFYSLVIAFLASLLLNYVSSGFWYAIFDLTATLSYLVWLTDWLTALFSYLKYSKSPIGCQCGTTELINPSEKVTIDDILHTNHVCIKSVSPEMVALENQKAAFEKYFNDKIAG